VVVQSTRATYLGAPRPRTDLQTASWRMLRQEWAGDSAAVAECERWERDRARVRPHMAALLQRFLSGAIGLEQFRSVFDRRTRTDWDAFALKGASGAMFLNAIVKHTEHRIVLARQLRAAFRAPKDVDVAATQLAELIGAVAPPVLALDTNETGESPAEKSVVAPAHAAFFATMCWHLQAPDQWPAFQPSSRRVLHDEEELFTATGDPIHDYLLFRESFLSLAAVLALTTWQLEHLCWWQSRRLPEADESLLGFEEAPRRSRSKTRRTLADTSAPRLTWVEPSVRASIPLSRADHDSSPSRPDGCSARDDRVRETPPPYVPFTEPPALDHTHVQWLLAKVGKQLGCRVWIAANDWRREWGGEPLGSLSVRALPPLGLGPDSQRVVSLIDVVWLTGVNQVAAAFEVEHTTSVYSGLLRMADLAALSPNLNFPLYVVAPASRLAKVRRELVRPTFRALELDRRCRFFSSEALLKALPSLARWATGPEAIEKLAEAVVGAD
jgi:hypothetical protein